MPERKIINPNEIESFKGGAKDILVDCIRELQNPRKNSTIPIGLLNSTFPLLQPDQIIDDREY
jgi:hypothetical protein